MQRRHLLQATAAAFAAPAFVRAAEPLKEVRLDFAYYSPSSLVLRRFGWLEEDFGRNGIGVKWVLSAGSNRAMSAACPAGSADVAATPDPALRMS